MQDYVDADRLAREIDRLSQAEDIPPYRRRQLIQLAADARGTWSAPQPGREGWPIIVSAKRGLKATP